MPENTAFTDDDVATGNYLVSFDPSVDPAKALDRLNNHGYAVEERFEFGHASEGALFAIDADTADDPLHLLGHPGVSDVSPDTTVSPALAPGVTAQSVDGNPPIDTEDIASLTSIEDTPGDGEGVTVAIVDSGIKADHEHFDSHEGTIEGTDFTGKSAPLEDDVGHGTGVASLYTTLAPKVDLISLRVFGDSGSSSGRRLIRVYQWLLEHASEIDIFNMSLGFGRTVSRLNELHNRVISRGVRDVTAAGNSGTASGTPATATNALSVGSIAEDGTISDFSSYNPDLGSKNPELMAPGELVKLADPGTGLGNPGLAEDGYTAGSGTSFSGPINGGLFARVISAQRQSAKMASLPDRYAPAKIAEAYVTTADDIPGTPRDGAGLVDQSATFEVLNPSRSGGDGGDSTPGPPPESPDSPDGSDDRPSGPDEPDQPRGPDEGTEWEVQVERIDDADSMGVRFPDGTKDTIRLMGVDSPELGGYTYPSEFESIPERPEGWNWLSKWAKKADEFATGQLADGKDIHIEVDPEGDRRGGYNRLLVYIYPEGPEQPSLNERLLSEGYARLYESEFSRLEEFRELEATAQDNGVGLWGFPGDEDDDDTSPEEPEDVTEADFADHVETLLEEEYGADNVLRSHHFERSGRIADFVVFDTDHGVMRTYELENTAESLISGAGQALYYRTESLYEWPDRGSSIPILCVPEGTLSESNRGERNTIEMMGVVIREIALE